MTPMQPYRTNSSDEAEVSLKFIESTYGNELAAEVRSHLQHRETA